MFQVDVKLFCVFFIVATSIFRVSGVIAATPDEIAAEIEAEALFSAEKGQYTQRVMVSNSRTWKEVLNGRAVIFFSDFESDNGGLTGSLDWEWGAKLQRA